MTNAQRLLKILKKRRKKGITIAEIKKTIPANNPYDVVLKARKLAPIESQKVNHASGYHFVYRLV